MENEKSSIEILKEFASRTGRKLEYTEKPYPSTAIHPVTYHRRTLYMPNNDGGTSYFACFGDSREFGKYSTFSGVFIHCPVSASIEIEFRNKDILDRFNPFQNKKTHSSGYRNFDSNVIIKGNDQRAVHKLSDKSQVRELILKTFKIDSALIIGVNSDPLNFVPGFKGSSNLGIFMIEEWILDTKQIEKLFEIAEALREFLVVR